MLSARGAFEGGTFTTPEADGSTTVHDFQRGDVICFVSHKYHHALPVTAGRREVLVIESGRGPLGAAPTAASRQRGRAATPTRRGRTTSCCHL